jgi:nicotinate-nucleotide adenylyltransferase
MKSVLIIGGSFDPIHNGHLQIALKAQQRLKADEVWFLLAKQPRWKKLSTPQNDRIKMLKIAIKDYPQFKYSDFEIKNTKPKEINFTINTAKKFKKLYPDHIFFYLIGTDQLEKLGQWEQIDDLSKIFKFVLANRPGYQSVKSNISKYGVVELGFDGPLVSSTLIRNFLSKDAPADVLNYIAEKGLYLENKLKIDLSELRYDHTLRVTNLAVKIARSNKQDINQTYVAAMLHDCAKELPKQTQLEIMQSYFSDELESSPQIYHQFSGTIIAQSSYNITDQEVLKAIKYHATASSNMSKLDKIIYCADKLEPGRDLEAAKLVELCKKDINLGFKEVLASNYEYLKKFVAKNHKIHPLTLAAYNKYVKGSKNG